MNKELILPQGKRASAGGKMWISAGELKRKATGGETAHLGVKSAALLFGGSAGGGFGRHLITRIARDLKTALQFQFL
jgi:hypothetical protein